MLLDHLEIIFADLLICLLSIQLPPFSLDLTHIIFLQIGPLLDISVEIEMEMKIKIDFPFHSFHIRNQFSEGDVTSLPSFLPSSCV
jgi:hypothetical protein